MAGDRNLKIKFVSESDQLKRDVAELDRKLGSLFAKDSHSYQIHHLH